MFPFCTGPHNLCCRQSWYDIRKSGFMFIRLIYILYFLLPSFMNFLSFFFHSFKNWNSKKTYSFVSMKWIITAKVIFVLSSIVETERMGICLLLRPLTTKNVTIWHYFKYLEIFTCLVPFLHSLSFLCIWSHSICQRLHLMLKTQVQEDMGHSFKEFPVTQRK